MVTLSNVGCAVLLAAFLLAAFDFIVVCVLCFSRRRKRYTDVRYYHGQLSWWDGVEWVCLDGDYKNSRIPQCISDEERRDLKDIKVLRCKMEEKHKHTIHIRNEGNKFVFRCGSCQDEIILSVDQLSDEQKQVLELQYPGIFDKK